jgi:hypothetical protein
VVLVGVGGGGGRWSLSERVTMGQQDTETIQLERLAQNKTLSDKIARWRLLRGWWIYGWRWMVMVG